MKDVINNFNLRKLLILPLFMLIAFTSCQDEVVEQTDPNEQETIVANSDLANLMQRTCGDDGSDDDILDGSDCISVNLPVTIVVNGITITINTLEDLALIQEIYDQSNTDEDILEFIFPITIILNDYTTVVINNIEELEQFIEDCTNNEEENDIECVGFVYPISFSIYDADFQLIDTVTVNSDQELYEFIDSLDGGLVASLNYPISLVYADGTTTEVNNNQELEDAINAAEEECDDDDDDCEVNLAELEAYLLECGLEAYTYDATGEIVDENYLEFNAGGEVIVNGTPTVTEVGSWSLSESDSGYVLTIDGLVTFDLLNGEWLLLGCDEDYFIFQQGTGNDAITMKLEQDCENEPDCTEQQVDAYLMECHWVTGFNGNNTFSEYRFEFNDNQVLLVTNATTNAVTTGVWVTSQASEGVIIDISLGAPLGDFNGAWTVIECAEDRIKVVSTGNQQPFIVFERECEQDPFECFANADESELVECDDDGDGIAEFDLTEAYSSCVNPAIYGLSYHETQADADANTNAIPNPTAYQNVADPQTVYLRVELTGTTTYEVFPIFLNITDCTDNTPNDLFNVLTDGVWIVALYNDSGVNETGDYTQYEFVFASGGIVTASDGTTTTSGTWSGYMNNAQLQMTLNFGAQMPLDEFNDDDWEVFDLAPARVELRDISGGDGSLDILVFEKL